MLLHDKWYHVTKAKEKHWMFALFLTSKISPLHVGYKSPTKAFNGDFRLCLPSWKSLESR